MFRWLKRFKTRTKLILLLFLAFVLWYAFLLPDPLFESNYSSVLYDRNGKLLEARVAKDGQWRFPAREQAPDRFVVCLVAFEDRHFYEHCGISIRGLGRAIKQNIKNGRIVSGGSTITMQLARMIRRKKGRNLWNKLQEMILATRLELKYSKKEIVQLYASHAPFGNNVVGLDAASWRYYGHPAKHLTWSECATLAVLPNAPGLIYPGKNHDLLLAKRNRLLKKLLEQGKLDTTAYTLATLEDIAGKPLPLPSAAPHLMQSLEKKYGKGKIFESCVDMYLQQQARRIADRNYDILKNKWIKNGAIIISSTKTGEVLAYIGNMPGASANDGKDVDCANARRSSGSLLKPVLFEAALEDGLITPKSLLMDIPSQFGAYAPKNFGKSFEGAIPANQALSKSLNIPFVLLLHAYGINKFCNRLQQSGLHSIDKNATHYGLTLILGGAEVTLQEITGVYRNMGATAMGTQNSELQFLKNKKSMDNIPKWKRECVKKTLDCMTELNRPDEEGNWKLFGSARKIAWKTGTSFGFRDAWAIGITPEYTIGVWVGNADGEGRAGLTGIHAAAPVMFDLFSALSKNDQWFDDHLNYKPFDICRESGNIASPNCPHKVTELLPESCGNAPCCSYHQIFSLSPDKKHVANGDCFPVHRLRFDTFFVLPPLAMKFYRQHSNIAEVPLPLNCMGKSGQQTLSLVYPRTNTRIQLSRTAKGQIGEIVLEAAPRDPAVTVYWHMDGQYLGSTKNIHQMLYTPAAGKHQIQITDDRGQHTQTSFEVVQ